MTNEQDEEVYGDFPALFTWEEVADAWKISRTHLYRLESEYGLKHVKVGKKMKRYSTKGMQEFIDKNSHFFSE